MARERLARVKGGSARLLAAPPWRYSDVLTHVVAVSFVTAIWLVTGQPALTLYVGGFVIGAVYLALMMLEMSRAPTLISPLSFYFLWYAIAIGPGSISIARRIAAGEMIQLKPFEIHPPALVWGFVLFLVGSVAFHFGVQITRPLDWTRAGPEPEVSKGSRRYPELLVLIWTLGVASRLLGSDRTMAGAIFSIFAWASNAALCAYCLSTSASRPRLSWPLLITGCVVELAFNVRTFSKAYIMYSFVPILWTCVYFKKYRPWIIPCGIGVVVFYLLIVAPVIGQARENIRRNDGEVGVGPIVSAYEQHDIGETDFLEQSDRFFERQFDPIPIGFIYGEVEKYGLRYGDSMDYLAYAFVPRFFWPEKPGVSRGAWFTVYLGGASNEEEATTATALTAPGELYWNFGTLGVVAGMILVGSLIGVLWRIAGPVPQQNPLRMLLYFVTVIAVADNAQAGVTVVSACHRILVLGSLIWLMDLLAPRALGRTGRKVMAFSGQQLKGFARRRSAITQAGCNRPEMR
jgi:hypothetical protein